MSADGKAIVIVGVGPGLGLSVAKRFGQDGYRVALISRSQEKLDGYVAELERMRVEAAGFAADVLDVPQLLAALSQARVRLGGIEILEFSPYPPPFVDVLNITQEEALHQFRFNVIAPIACVRHVLPEMLERKRGALLFTTGVSGYMPMAPFANVGLGMSALRNYAAALNQALSPEGIYVGTICIGTRVAKGGPGDPDVIAELYHDMCEKRDRVEELILGSAAQGGASR